MIQVVTHQRVSNWRTVPSSLADQNMWGFSGSTSTICGHPHSQQEVQATVSLDNVCIISVSCSPEVHMVQLTMQTSSRAACTKLGSQKCQGT